jgi:hypothetical protein
MSESRFYAPSAGVGMANAIEEFFVKRALEERQQMLDAQNRQKNAADIRQRDERLRLDRGREEREAAAQKAAQEDLAKQREFQRANTIAENALPGDEYDTETADLLRRAGHGNQLKTLPGQPASLGFGVLEQAEQPAEGTGVLAQSPAPGILMPAQDERTVARGGSKYLAQRTAAEERAAQAKAAQDAAAERAAADRENRMLMAQLAQGGKSEINGLRAQLLEQQINEKKAKEAERQAAEQRSTDAVTQYEGDINSVLNDLIDESGNLRPDIAGTVGFMDSRTPDITEGTNTALSKIDRLMGLLDINKLREMKSQSKTGASGFGALSEGELRLLESAAATLRNRGQSESSYAKELQRIRDTVRKGKGGSPKRVVYDINGNPVQQ